MISTSSEDCLFMIAHTCSNGGTVLSIDIQRHHDDDGVFGQFDVFELLKDVEPFPLVFAAPAAPANPVAPPKPESPPTLPAAEPAEKPAEPAEKQPAEKPAEKQPAEKQPAEKPAEPAEKQPAEKPVEPAEEQPAKIIVHRKRARHTILTDAIIIKYVDVHGPRWRELARTLGGRRAGYSDDIVRNRYIRVMEAIGTPYISTRARTETPRKPAIRVGHWTPNDDARIFEGVRLFGTKWADVAQHVGGSRTTQATRNRASRIGAGVQSRLAKQVL